MLLHDVSVVVHQERLDASSEAQRRREAEVDRRLQEDKAKRERDEASRWSRNRWGQQPLGAPCIHPAEVHDEVRLMSPQDLTRSPTVCGDALAALRGAVESTVLCDEVRSNAGAKLRSKSSFSLRRWTSK